MKKYDVFTFFNELDLLDLRFRILNDYVDYFVILECNETFSGLPKELFYENNKERFKDFEHKIIHLITDDVPKDFTDAELRLGTEESELKRTIIKQALVSPNVPPGEIHWLKEFYQKELLRRVFEIMEDDDICFISDLDEIWNPETHIDFSSDKIFKLNQISYCYYLNNRSNEQWDGTLVAKRGILKNYILNHLRANCKIKLIYVDNGGWHFTNMGGADNVRKKIESYGHQEFNNDLIKSQIDNRIMNNEDFLGRGNYVFWVDETDLPQHIKNNKDKYNNFFKG
jgi:beta-1,4-mannosyl-glycoprotein beta-1,4-N-acetylglucosaminyltransferase